MKKTVFVISMAAMLALSLALTACGGKPASSKAVSLAPWEQKVTGASSAAGVKSTAPSAASAASAISKAPSSASSAASKAVSGATSVIPAGDLGKFAVIGEAKKIRDLSNDELKTYIMSYVNLLNTGLLSGSWNSVGDISAGDLQAFFSGNLTAEERSGLLASYPSGAPLSVVGPFLTSFFDLSDAQITKAAAKDTGAYPVAKTAPAPASTARLKYYEYENKTMWVDLIVTAGGKSSTGRLTMQEAADGRYRFVSYVQDK